MNTTSRKQAPAGFSDTARFDDFVRHWAPVAEPDYAKVIVWGFVAGFSERFVPDILERFANAGRESLSAHPNQATNLEYQKPPMA